MIYEMKNKIVFYLTCLYNYPQYFK